MTHLLNRTVGAVAIAGRVGIDVGREAVGLRQSVQHSKVQSSSRDG